jgi:aryl-alcohol dehydrogenase-like predicted oxidoreductase
MRGRYPRWHLRNAVEQALRRLHLERIDLFQLHGWFASGVQSLDWLETLNELRVEGRSNTPGSPSGTTGRMKARIWRR